MIQIFEDIRWSNIETDFFGKKSVSAPHSERTSVKLFVVGHDNLRKGSVSAENRMAALLTFKEKPTFLKKTVAGNTMR